jgi:hypothetical protein
MCEREERPYNLPSSQKALSIGGAWWKSLDLTAKTLLPPEESSPKKKQIPLF